MEKLLVTQALDERDLLVKKINDKINKLEVLDTIKANEEKVLTLRLSKEEFEKQAKAALQQVEDLISRHQKIDAAIVASNAETKIETTYGTFTVAGAIALRNRLRGKGNNLSKESEGIMIRPVVQNELDFEGKLYAKLERSYTMKLNELELKNRQLQATAESMRLSILGKENKSKDDKPLAVVEAYVKENTTELVDPLDVRKKMELLKEKKETLLNELETKIKVSNATTFIEF